VNARLAPCSREPENECVLIRTRFALFAAAIAVPLLCASAVAQYGDRDRSGAPPTSAKAPPPEARIDINHASLDELLKVPGMTSSWAGRIVRFRPYRTKQDLLDRGVLPSKVYDRMKDYIIAHRDRE
jgi:DNA uptake protein ComE-like DNA-binding protein